MKKKLINIFLIVLVILVMLSVNSYGWKLGSIEMSGDGYMAFLLQHWKNITKATNPFDDDMKNIIGGTLYAGAYWSHYFDENPSCPGGANCIKKSKYTGYGPGTSKPGIPAIMRRSAACLAHTQGNYFDTDVTYRVTDILDINIDNIDDLGDEDNKDNIDNINNIDYINYTGDGDEKVSTKTFSGEAAEWVNALAYATYYRYNDTSYKISNKHSGYNRNTVQYIFGNGNDSNNNEVGCYNAVKDILSEHFQTVYSKSDIKVGDSINESLLKNALEYGKKASNYSAITFEKESEPKAIYSGNNTYIGPLVLNYGGTETAEFVITDNNGAQKTVSYTEGYHYTSHYLDDNGSCTSEKILKAEGAWKGGCWATSSDGGKTFTDYTDGFIESGKSFYLKVDGYKFLAPEVKVTRTMPKYMTRLYLLTDYKNTGQELAMFICKKEDLTTSDTIKVKIPTGSLIITKEDANDSNTKLKAGFKIQDSLGNYLKINGATQLGQSATTITTVDVTSTETTTESGATIVYTPGGSITLNQLIAGTYTVTEVVSPDESSYPLAKQTTLTQSKTVPAGGSITAPFTNIGVGNIEIIKKDADTGERLDAGFKIQDSSGKYLKIVGKITYEHGTRMEISSISTTNNESQATELYTTEGSLFIYSLPAGKYTVVETTSPDENKYPLNLQTETSKDIEINAGSSSWIDFTNKGVGTLQITKVDADNSNTNLKAGFKIYDEEAKKYLIINGSTQLGKTQTKALNITVTSLSTTTTASDATEIFTPNGSATINKLPTGTYKIIETTLPDAEKYPSYIQSLTQGGIEVKTGEATPVIFTNIGAGTLEITKVDADDANTNLSAGFTIYDKDAKQYLIINGKTEIKSSKIPVTSLSTTNDITKATIIYTPNGKATITRLKRGTYKIMEIKPPHVDNYPLYIQSPILDNIEVKTGEIKPAPFTNIGAGILKITKKDSITEEPLRAGFKIYDNEAKKYLILNGEDKIELSKIILKSVSTTDDEAAATEIFTPEGEVIITRLKRGTYTVKETTSPNAEVYPLALQELTSEPKEVTTGGSDAEANFINKPVGNLEITKIDGTTKLANVEFRIKNSEGNYLRINEKSGTTVTKVNRQTESVTISWDGQATYDSTGTIFVTNENGKININNLFVGTYTLVEEKNNNPEYEDNGYEKEFTLEVDEERSEVIPTPIKVENKIRYVKLSGRVWIDKPDGKSYTAEAKYEPNIDTDAAGIKVELIGPDANGKITVLNNVETNADGTYIFEEKNADGKYLVDVERIDEYYVRFTYDGLKYTSIGINVKDINGSKAKEVAEDRIKINEKYTIINKEIIEVAKDEDNYEEYRKVTATTKATEEWLKETTKEEVNILKAPESGNTIQNINLGIILREQPDLELTEELQNAEVVVNGYTHTYSYVSYKENESASSMAVEFKNDKLNAFTRPIYPSDIALAAEEGSDKLQIYATYKITLTNHSNSLIAKVNEIVNYYDKNYEIDTIKFGTETVNSSDVVKNLEEDVFNDVENKYTKTKLDLNKLGEIGKGSPKEITIRYKVNTQKMIDILLTKNEDKGITGNELPLNTKSEILSYVSYYGDNSYEGSGYTKGDITAGIDPNSTPGNGIIKPEENDGDSATVFKLKIYDHTREIKGTVWNDEKLSGQAIGNGVLNIGEKMMQGVKVDLINPENEVLAKTYIIKDEVDLSTGKYKTDVSGDATFTTESDGTYTISGILPGEYVLRYTYEDGTTKIVDPNGNIDIKVRNYKSTILKGKAADVLKNILTGNDKLNWIQGETTNYNDARDNLVKRNSIDNNTNIIYGNISKQETMYADTPKFALGVELIPVQGNDGKVTESPAYYKKADGTFALIDYSKVENIDFGIIERPKINAEISKKITYIKVTLGNGQILIEGDPSLGASITYVKTGLDGIVPMEIDFELLPAELDIEYTITLKDTSKELDYVNNDNTNNEGYYYYGTPSGSGGSYKARTMKINKIVDYLPSELIYDAEKTKTANENEEYWETKTAKELQELYFTEEEKNNPTFDGTNKYLISNDVKASVSSGYTILVTNDEAKKKFNDDLKKPTLDADGNVTDDGSVSVKICAKSRVSSASDLNFVNHTEIIDYNSTTLITKPDPTDPTKTIKISTPGNYDPSDSSTQDEGDDAKVKYTITPPTGENKDYTIYYIISISALLILGVGVVIIKKKIIKK